MSVKYIIEKLESGVVFEWLHVGCVDYCQTNHGIDVYYAQDLIDGTVWSTITRPELISELKEGYPFGKCFTDDSFARAALPQPI